MSLTPGEIAKLSEYAKRSEYGLELFSAAEVVKRRGGTIEGLICLCRNMAPYILSANIERLVNRTFDEGRWHIYEAEEE